MVACVTKDHRSPLSHRVAELQWLRYGFSERAGGVSQVYGAGVMNLGFTKDDAPVAVEQNRARFALNVAGDAAMKLLTQRQVHGVHIERVTAEDARDGFARVCTPENRGVLEADGWMTDQPGALLSIQTADCVPVLLADQHGRVVAALHAGWRGTAEGIVELAVRQMGERYGTSPGAIVAAVGPGIGACCYRVGEEVLERFRDRWPYADELFRQVAEPGAKERYLDLAEANRRQLADAGVPVESIEVVGECTGCARTSSGERKYFSHRIEQGFTGRMMSAIGIV